MADQESDSSEKEFEASEEKRRQAREDGNIPQSKEAAGFALVLGILCAAMLANAFIGGEMLRMIGSFFYHSNDFAADAFSGRGSGVRDWITQFALLSLPIFAILAACTLVMLVMTRGVAFSVKKIMPDVKKISPGENIKKRYGASGLLDFLKDTVKLLFAGMIAAVFLVQFANDYYGSSAIDGGEFASFTFRQVLKIIIAFAVFQSVLAAIDLPLQYRLHANRLKMTREDMKKEAKQSEGDPQLKQQRRQKASQISRGQMIQNVKNSTVVMVNPEHYAVALKWDPESGKAPICVAKGVDHLAAKIREAAIANQIPIYRDPPSTRSIYRLVEIDGEIRPEHFAAVAAAIQYVERIRRIAQGLEG